jgi:colanic acid biosynthesis glycosyl transferase WcaI
VVAKTDPPLISIAAAIVAGLRGARLVNWLQDVFPEVASHLGANPLPQWLNAALTGLRDRSLIAARVNVVLGGRMRRHLEQRRIPPERIEIIENWADGEMVAPKPVERSALRSALGLGGKFVVAYSGNLGRAHEYDTLVNAAELLRETPDIVFMMIGGGAKMQQLRAEVQRRMLESFRFLPYQPRDQLSDALAAADIHLACLLPALEGLIVPSKFYGILAAGRPAIFIGDRDGEIARIITDARCGAVVQTGDAAALAQIIARLRAEEGERTQMGVRARQLFASKYTVERAAEQWLHVIAGANAQNAKVEAVAGSRPCRTAANRSR